MPKSNIYIRHHLTLAGLAYAAQAGSLSAGRRRWLAAVVTGSLARASRAMYAATHDPETGDEELPFIDGAEYLEYTYIAAEYADSQTNMMPLASEFNSQRELFSQMAAPKGWCASNDTRRNFRISPSKEASFSNPAFTVFRAHGEFLLVHHDRRVCRLRHRLNLHVENTYGVVVRSQDDWPFWYPETGWPGKRLSIFWRIFPPLLLWDYGTVRGHIARRHRLTGDCQFILWKKGEQGHQKDYWHRLGDGWSEEFIA